MNDPVSVVSFRELCIGYLFYPPLIQSPLHVTRYEKQKIQLNSTHSVNKCVIVIVKIFCLHYSHCVWHLIRVNVVVAPLCVAFWSDWPPLPSHLLLSVSLSIRFFQPVCVRVHVFYLRFPLFLIAFLRPFTARTYPN